VTTRERDETVALSECPIGLFWHEGDLCLKTEYHRENGSIEAYVVESGESFWGPAPQTVASLRACRVLPISTDDAIRRLIAKPLPATPRADDGAPTFAGDRMPEVGALVRVVRLKPAMGFMVNARHVAARRCPGVGRFKGHIPGHGGDGWWIEHDDDGFGGKNQDFLVAAYTYDELAPFERAGPRPDSPTPTPTREGEVVDPDAPIKCGTFGGVEIPPDVRARMDADRRIAELIAAGRSLQDALIIILPMAKGYAAEHRVGRNDAHVRHASDALEASWCALPGEDPDPATTRPASGEEG
jgi:hypothetical protein